MKNKILGHVIKLFCCISWLLIIPVQAAENNNILIESLSLELDLAEKVAKYSQEVVVKSGANRLECDRMDVFFDNQDEQKYNENFSIKKILFFDNIILNNGQKIINASKGEYLADKRIIYFWENVVIKDGGNYLEADKVMYDLQKELVTILNDPTKEDTEKKRVRIILDEREGR